MIALGFDIGTHRIAISAPSLGWAEEIDVAKSHGPSRRDEGLRVLQEWTTQRIIRERGDVVAFIERPFLSGSIANPNTTIGMAETVGIIRACVQWHAPTTLVNPSTWKAELIGNGRADKDEVRRWLIETRGFPADEYSEDMVDATCVGLYGEELIAGRVALPQPAKKKRRKRATKRA